ncbi:hypothetical protein [Catenuloplanes atrovinosus]|uniref:RHIM domain-containing protein n=1 Tax=Catenuloplanes atrovinosus TaxID=137266 RepID=A0AAE4CAD4_9ACTN|nr:hypothetical protein [Catenuloplanes atrovinosus]MDR7275714.1 hypothetical protein [Catenuloplanes atrovinosus]
MTAIELIAAALAAGAGAGLTQTASDTVRDAYAGLKDLLRRRLGDRAVPALEADETEPGVWQARLGDALTSSGAAGDEQVVAAARRLLDLTGKYQVDAREAKGVQVGDHNTQTNTFH